MNQRSRPSLIKDQASVNPLEEEQKSVISKMESKFKSNYSSSKHGASKKTGSKKSSQQNDDDIEEEESDSNDPKFELPNDCKLEVMQSIKIESLEDDYVLIAHPFPQMEGEMVVFQ